MKRLFVAMPYGIRKAPLDYEKPEKTVKINFDAVWKGMIQPAVPSDFETKRADELRQPGLIARLYNEWLFDADIVLADLTFGNPNVFYELGIRQALLPKGTVLVACAGTKLPFDVHDQYVIYYDCFDATTVHSFQAQLCQAIENASGREVDSPVHVFLPGLFVRRYQQGHTPEAEIQELRQRVKELETEVSKRSSQDAEERLIRKLQEATTSARVLGLYRFIDASEACSVNLLELLAIRLHKFGHFDEALQVLFRALKEAPEDSEILREIGFVYRKKGPEFYPQAESYMSQALQLDDGDAELHGVIGGLYKRQGDYEQALTHYKRAHQIEPEDLYPLVTLGAMYGALGNVQEARDWYQKLEAACERLISEGKEDHWTYFCLGQVAVARGDGVGAEAAYRKAIARKPPIEDVRSEFEQLCFLQEKNFAAETIRFVLPILEDVLMTLERQSGPRNG